MNEAPDPAAVVGRLRELEQRAMGAPWEVYVGTPALYVNSGTDTVCSLADLGPFYKRHDADAAFIAEVRNALPALLDAYEDAVARAEKAEAELADRRLAALRCNCPTEMPPPGSGMGGRCPYHGPWSVSS